MVVLRWRVDPKDDAHLGIKRRNALSAKVIASREGQAVAANLERAGDELAGAPVGIGDTRGEAFAIALERELDAAGRTAAARVEDMSGDRAQRVPSRKSFVRRSLVIFSCSPAAMRSSVAAPF